MINWVINYRLAANDVHKWTDLLLVQICYLYENEHAQSWMKTMLGCFSACSQARKPFHAFLRHICPENCELAQNRLSKAEAISSVGHKGDEWGRKGLEMVEGVGWYESIPTKLSFMLAMLAKLYWSWSIVSIWILCWHLRQCSKLSEISPMSRFSNV